ncbi:MAG: hypothetical protein K5784_04570 [Clostridiales bacterium]|nr:hypothetical protein [Clostridiales bacterium]
MASRRAAQVMTEMAAEVLKSDVSTGMEAFNVIKKRFDGENDRLKKAAASTREKLENMFAFCEKVFPDGQELLILVTELTLNPNAARFIGKYGCDAYFRHNKNLLFYERKQEIMFSIDELGL